MFWLNYKRLIYYLLPPTKRKKTDGSLMLRASWWQYLITPMEYVMNLFHLYRIEAIIRANVTMQFYLLEWYLKREIDNSVYLSEPDDGGFFISKHDATVTVPLTVGISYLSELGEFIGLFKDSNINDFIINISPFITPQQIEYLRSILKQYVFPTITYKIELI